MGAVGIGGGLLMLLLLAMSGRGGSPPPKKLDPEPTPGPTPEPRPTPSPPEPGPRPAPEPLPGNDDDLADVDEAEIIPLVCEMLAKSMPFTKDIDFAMQVLKGAFVGYDWALVPPGSERARLIALTTEIVKGTRSGAISCDLPIEIDDNPTAGGYYQIKHDDYPLGIIGKAYPWANGSQRAALVKAVTNHPSNGGGVIGQGIIVATVQQANINIIGPKVFSMFKKWRCNPETSPQRFEPGTCYAVVFLPLIAQA